MSNTTVPHCTKCSLFFTCLYNQWKTCPLLDKPEKKNDDNRSGA